MFAREVMTANPASTIRTVVGFTYSRTFCHWLQMSQLPVKTRPVSTRAMAVPSKEGVPAVSPVATWSKNWFSAVVTLLVNE